MILDLEDPAQPKEAGRWWMPGQKAGEPRPDKAPRAFHGPAMISPDGKLATLAYAPSLVNLDISNPARPKLVGSLQFTPPFFGGGGQALHTAFPLWDRNLVHVNSEAQNERCKEPLHFAGLVDNSNPAAPRFISMYPVPVPPKGAPYKNFCEKGGRFGPHNVNQEIHLPEVEKPGNLIYLTYFNAGLRVYNIRDPRLPVESGWFIPPAPASNAGRAPARRRLDPDRRRAGRHPRQHLRHRQELGPVGAALFRARPAGANRSLTSGLLTKSVDEPEFPWGTEFCPIFPI